MDINKGFFENDKVKVGIISLLAAAAVGVAVVTASKVIENRKKNKENKDKSDTTKTVGEQTFSFMETD